MIKLENVVQGMEVTEKGYFKCYGQDNTVPMKKKRHVQNQDQNWYIMI